MPCVVHLLGSIMSPFPAIQNYSGIGNSKNDFTGEGSLALMLPPGISGVSAETAVVPEDKNQIDFIINVAADATVGNHAFVNLRAQVEFKEQSVNIDQTIPLHIQ